MKRLSVICIARLRAARPHKTLPQRHGAIFIIFDEFQYHTSIVMLTGLISSLVTRFVKSLRELDKFYK
jgi:hypothetical protein